MSAKKRRIKRKIKMLRRLDATYHRLYVMTSRRRDGPRSWRLWWNGVVALGDAMQRKGYPAWQSLNRSDAGKQALMHIYFKRQGSA